MEKEYSLINIRIRELRKRLGLTQSVFAEKAGLAENTIAQIEINKKQPSIGTILKISNAFETNPIFFLQDYLNVDVEDCSFLIEKQVSQEFEKLTNSQQKYIMQVILNIIKFLNTDENHT